MRLLTLVGLVILLAVEPGHIETAAGTGQAAHAGDGGPAVQAQLNQPFQCVIDPNGDLLIVEAFNHCVRKIDRKTGVITTIVGTGKKGYTGDGGPGRQATLNDPHSLDCDANGDLYIADRLNFAIRKVDGRTGIISTIAGSGAKAGELGDGGPAVKAALREPDDCCLDGKGGLLIADVADWRIRRVDLKTGVISTFAGTGRPTGKTDRARTGDDGPAAKAVIVGARAVCVDGRGNTYICEREGHSIRKVDSSGIVTTFAGTGQKGYSGDGGPARQCTLNGPKAIRCDKAGNLLVADTENHAIRRIDAQTLRITTVAGGRKGAGGDHGPATEAGLDRPHGCIATPDGWLYIADSSNHRVRRVRLQP